MQLAVDALHILAHRQGGHAVLVVRDTTQLGSLAREERLPPGGATALSMSRGPVNQLGRVLIRAHEQDLVLAVQVDDGILDTRAGGRQEQIQDTVDVLFEGHAGLVLVVDVQQDNTLGTAFGDILVLALLRVGQVVVLIEQRTGIDAIGFLVATLDDPNTASRDVPEAQMETAELGADDEEHTIERLGVLVLGQKVRVESEAQRDLGGGEEVGLEDGGVEDAESRHDHLVVLVGGGGGNQLL